MIDKSTHDAIICGDDNYLKIAKLNKECLRVLKVGGVSYTVSFGKPEERGAHFWQPFLSWDFRQFMIHDSACKTEEDRNQPARCHYIYTGRKREDSDAILEREFDKFVENLGYGHTLHKAVKEQTGDVGNHVNAQFLSEE